MTGQRSLDTYLCYGAPDAGWVRILAGDLFAADLTALLDPWHPDQTDLRPLRVSQGYREARWAVLVIGPGADATVREHYRTMLATPSDVGHVVVLHGDTRQPDFVTGHTIVDFRDTGAYQQRLDDLITLVGPPLVSRPLASDPSAPGALAPDSSAPDAFIADSSAFASGPRSAGATAVLRVTDNHVACHIGTTSTAITADITVDWHQFNALLWNRQRREPEALRAIGTALGATFTPDPVGRELEDAASAAYANGDVLTIAIAADGELGELPWESLILPGHDEPLALHPATRIYRSHVEPPSPVPSDPGLAGGVATVAPPLRILGVLACPDDGSVSDHERELAALVDALEPARKYHGAQVRILTEATTAAIDEALRHEPCHVLHLACHSRAGALLLEDGSELTPDVAATIGARAGLVVLSGPWTVQTAPGVTALITIARSLVAAGTPQVLVMTAPTTSRYATALFADLYRELALAANPEVLTALAHARRDAERRRRVEVTTTGRPVPAEWATPALYQRDQPAPLYHPTTAPARRPALTSTASVESTVAPDSGTTVDSGAALDSDSAFGSSAMFESGTALETGATLESGATLDSGTALETGATLEAGATLDSCTALESGGVLESGSAFASGAALDSGAGLGSGAAHGFGEVGNRVSTGTEAAFAGRRTDLRRLLVVLRQPGHPGTLLYGMAGVGKTALADAAVRRLGSAAGAVVRLAGAVNADRLLTAVERALAATGKTLPAESPARLDALASAPVLVRLDNMEANLVRTGDDEWVLADPRLVDVLSRLDGRLVMTSRHPFELPGVQLWRSHVGPLTWAEARLLLGRLPALDTLSLAEQNTAYVDSGGHPGTLEVLDELLRRPGASFTALRHRMEQLLLDRKIDRPDLWMAQVGRHGVDTSLAEAVTSAVYADLQSDAAQPLPVPR